MIVMKKWFSVTDKTRIYLAIGFLAGILWLVGLRFFLIRSHEVHYHANFAIYVNGQQDELKSFTFYEEVQSCTADELNDPKTRIHLHNQEANAVHVHDQAATWGHLFNNLGYGLTSNLIQTDQGTFTDGVDGKKLTFYLNGQEVDAVTNRTVGDEDVLLVNFGTENSDEIHKRYDEIPRTAAEHNQKSDPSSCSGGRPLTLNERLRRAVNLSE